MRIEKNISYPKLNEIDVVILCGGFGKRLQNVIKDIPKPMAEINCRPFLDILIDFVASFGFRHFILCVGYRANIIENYFQRKRGNLDIEFSKEQKHLDTGGAIKNAEAYIKSNPFLVMNGDSFCKIDLRDFVRFHQSKNALFSMVVAKTINNKDYGAIALDDSQRIIKFSKRVKSDRRDGFINAGIYLFQRQVLSLMPAGKSFSLERNFFPAFVNKGAYGYITEAQLIDIGTPVRYKKAKQILSKESFRI